MSRQSPSYFDEYFKDWFVHGVNSDGIHVDLVDTKGDGLTNISKAHACFIMAERDALLETIRYLCNKFDKDNYNVMLEAYKVYKEEVDERD